MFETRTIMTTDIIAVKKHTPVNRVIEILLENDITGLPVVNDDMTLAGIISEKDVLTLLSDLKDESAKVEDFMTKDTIIENTTIEDTTPEDTIIEVIILTRTTAENITSENIMNILFRMIATTWAGYSLSQVGHLDSPLAAYFDQSGVKSWVWC